MGQPKLRSMNHELLVGMVEGTYKSIIPNRSNVQFPDEATSTEEFRKEMPWPYGLYESPRKITPDLRFVER